ncbi:hypothetical protein C8J57DRAFT_1572165 [Mycena rebaudengoi]|nr:hypothetical protein C8J57DRAFT_1572165 [Mycena rebaudengoi]
MHPRANQLEAGARVSSSRSGQPASTSARPANQWRDSALSAEHPGIYNIHVVIARSPRSLSRARISAANVSPASFSGPQLCSLSQVHTHCDSFGRVKFSLFSVYPFVLPADFPDGRLLDVRPDDSGAPSGTGSLETADTPKYFDEGIGLLIAPCTNNNATYSLGIHSGARAQFIGSQGQQDLCAYNKLPCAPDYLRTQTHRIARVLHPTNDYLCAGLHGTVCSGRPQRPSQSAPPPMHSPRRAQSVRRAAARENGARTSARSVRLLSDTSADRSAAASRRTKLLAALASDPCTELANSTQYAGPAAAYLIPRPGIFARSPPPHMADDHFSQRAAFHVRPIGSTTVGLVFQRSVIVAAFIQSRPRHPSSPPHDNRFSTRSRTGMFARPAASSRTGLAALHIHEWRLSRQSLLLVRRLGAISLV